MNKGMMHIIKRFEEKLRELMAEQEYQEFSTRVAKEAFAIEIDEMPDGDFKDFCQDNFLEITRTDK